VSRGQRLRAPWPTPFRLLDLPRAPRPPVPALAPRFQATLREQPALLHQVPTRAHVGELARAREPRWLDRLQRARQSQARENEALREATHASARRAVGVDAAPPGHPDSAAPAWDGRARRSNPQSAWWWEDVAGRAPAR